MFQYPIPTADELGAFYSESYYAHQPPTIDFEPRGLRHRGIWLKLHYLKWLRGYSHLPVFGNPVLGYLGLLLSYKPLHADSPAFRPGGTFLDFGCGSGQAVAFAQYLGWNAEGIEINGKAVQAGRAAGIRIDQGSIDVLENRANRYDCITSFHCVEHVPEVRRLFQAFFGALKPGGQLAIDVPNGDSAALGRFREFSYYLGMPVHVHLFSRASLELLARSAGFVHINVATYSRWYAQSQSAVLSIRARGRASAPLQFQSNGRWEAFLGRLASLPTYLNSLAQFRGDCLVMTCVKPS